MGSFPGGSDDKEYTYNVGDLDLIPGLRRSPGEGHSNPLQYACLVHSVDRGALAGYSSWVAKNQVQLSNYCFFFFFFRKIIQNYKHEIRQRRWKGPIKWQVQKLKSYCTACTA